MKEDTKGSVATAQLGSARLGFHGLAMFLASEPHQTYGLYLLLGSARLISSSAAAWCIQIWKF